MSWRKDDKKLQEFLPKMPERFKDATLKFKNGKTISVFEDLFFGPKLDSSKIYNFEDYEAKTFEKVLIYVNSNSDFSKVSLDGEELMEVAYLANKIGYPKLSDSCVSIVKNRLGKTFDHRLALTIALTFDKMMAFTNALTFDKMMAFDINTLVAVVFIEKLAPIMKEEDWKRLSLDFVAKLLEKRCLNATEGQIIKGAAAWCSARPGKALALFKEHFLPIMKPKCLTRPDYEAYVVPIEFLPDSIKRRFLEDCATDVGELDPFTVGRGDLESFHVVAYTINSDEFTEAIVAGSIQSSLVTDGYRLDLEFSRVRKEEEKSLVVGNFYIRAKLKSLKLVNHKVIGWVTSDGQGAKVSDWRDENTWTAELDIKPHGPDFTIYALMYDQLQTTVEYCYNLAYNGHAITNPSFRARRHDVKTAVCHKTQKVSFDLPNGKPGCLATIAYSKQNTYSGDYQNKKENVYMQAFKLVLCSLKDFKVEYEWGNKFQRYLQNKVYDYLAGLKLLVVVWGGVTCPRPPSNLQLRVVPVVYHSGTGSPVFDTVYPAEHMYDLLDKPTKILYKLKKCDMNFYIVKVGGAWRQVEEEQKMRKFSLHRYLNMNLGNFDILVAEPASLPPHKKFPVAHVLSEDQIAIDDKEEEEEEEDFDLDNMDEEQEKKFKANCRRTFDFFLDACQLQYKKFGHL